MSASDEPSGVKCAARGARGACGGESVVMAKRPLEAHVMRDEKLALLAMLRGGERRRAASEPGAAASSAR